VIIPPLLFSWWDLLVLPAVLILAALEAAGHINKDSISPWAIYRRMVVVLGATLVPAFVVIQSMARADKADGIADNVWWLGLVAGAVASAGVWAVLLTIPAVRNWLGAMSRASGALKRLCEVDR